MREFVPFSRRDQGWGSWYQMTRCASPTCAWNANLRVSAASQSNLSLQKLFTAPPLLRCNFSDIVLLKIKVRRELDSALETVSALLPDKLAVEKLYRKAVEQDYGFIWFALGRPDNDTIHFGFGPGVKIQKIPSQARND